MFIMSTYFHIAVLMLMFSEGFYQFRQFYFIIVTKHREPYYIVFAYGKVTFNSFHRISSVLIQGPLKKTQGARKVPSLIHGFPVSRVV